jgi:serine/threonine protein kinase
MECLISSGLSEKKSNRYDISEKNKQNICTKSINYYINKQIGFGSYSNIFNVVYSSVNETKERSESPRCIKIFKGADVYTKYGEKEVKLLNKIKQPNLVVSLLDSFMHLSHFCIISNKFNLNLYEYYNKSFLCKNDIKFIFKQLLKGLIHLKKNKIIHGDLKPENILINHNGGHITDCVVCDFNLAIDKSKTILNYKDTNVTTIWYRAPEIYLDMAYSYEIDMWAFGCILYELIALTPLFCTKTTKDNIINNKRLHEQHLTFIGICPFVLLEKYGVLDLNNKINFNSKIFKTGFQNVFTQCILWDPKKRILPEYALNLINDII